MIVFDNSNFNDSDVDYLTFTNDFKIELSRKIKIILGPNGIGKTTIYKNIRSRHSEYGYIDYNDVENSVIARGDNLVIASNVATIVAKENEVKKILDSIDTKKTMKDAFGLSSKTKCESITNTLNDYRNDTKKAIEKFNSAKLDVLFDLDEDVKDLFVNYGKKIIEQSIEEVKLEEIKSSYRKKYLEIIERSLNGDEVTCPVCGAVCDEPIKDIIKRTLDSINETNNEIVKDYISKNPDVQSETVLNKVNDLRETITHNDICIGDLEDYIICGGNKEKKEIIVSAKSRLIQLENEIGALENDKLQFYNSIKSIEERIREVFQHQLEIPETNVEFNDDTKELNIKLPRSVEKYSTGEINLITFIVSLLEFINSDKNTLIIDDPLSSYDIPNQYKIIYEITASNKEDNYILLFTHNIDCLNIANSQNSKSYEYELMDKVNGSLYLNKVTKSLEESGFSINHILKNLDVTYPYKGFLKLLSEKDTWGRTSTKHKLFHYDSSHSESINGIVYSNEDLINLIDNLNIHNVINSDYLINSANKIMYLAALRVWIEKKFIENTNDLVGLQQKNELSNKIVFMFDENHWTGTINVTKSFLMSKKVMLNQNDHAQSQKEPFYYALSLSTENIIKEIIDIKEHFCN